jgi:hypothetical protein
VIPRISTNLVKLHIKDIISCELGDKCLKATEKVPLSNSTALRRLEDIYIIVRF